MTDIAILVQQVEADEFLKGKDKVLRKFQKEPIIAQCNIGNSQPVDFPLKVNNNNDCNENQKDNQSKGESPVEKGSLNDASLESTGTAQRPENKRRRNLRKSLSRQLSESLAPVKPETPLGWTTCLTTVASIAIAYEFRRQKRLTTRPSVYTQNNSKYMDLLRNMLAHGSKDGFSILTRKIKPSLFVGTRSVLSSTASYVIPHFPGEETHVRFREIMHMEADGAQVAIDWEIPVDSYSSSLQTRKTKKQYVDNVKFGPIKHPVIVILHGLNNDASFGYMRSLMRSCTDHGWIACGFNFRGCGHVKLTTPRSYNAGFTGDLRSIIQKIQSRLVDPENTPVFLVGNSLGANIMTKYLGEEGYSNTLPKCVKGGLSLGKWVNDWLYLNIIIFINSQFRVFSVGNPLDINGKNICFPWNSLLAAGVKKTVFENWTPIHKMSNCIHFKKALKEMLLSSTIGEFDHKMAPFMIRNDPQYPFNTKVGFKDGEHYWYDSSSNRYTQHVSVPLMILSSQDDFLVADPALRSMAQCLCNPNILVVKTRCGGHLGWHEAPPSGNFGIGKSWADTAMADFFSSVLKTNDLLQKKKTSHLQSLPVGKIVESIYSSTQIKSKL